MKLITGMHRSATSMVSRLFYEAGGDFGNPGTLYRGDKWNPDGYFEQPDFHKINIPLINGPWGKFAYFWLPSQQTILKRAASYADDIRRVSALYQGKIVKEVRFSLTLPGWLENGGNVERVIVCLREPYQVARSIAIRNKTFIRHGLHLWYKHNIALRDSLGDLPTHYVSYSHLLVPKTAVGEMTAAFRFFGLALTDEKIADICRRVIDSSKSDCIEGGRRYPAHIQSLWEELLNRHSSQTTEAVPRSGRNGI